MRIFLMINLVAAGILLAGCASDYKTAVTLDTVGRKRRRRKQFLQRMARWWSIPLLGEAPILTAVTLTGRNTPITAFIPRMESFSSGSITIRERPFKIRHPFRWRPGNIGFTSGRMVSDILRFRF